MAQFALMVPNLGAPVIKTTRPIPSPKGNQLLVKVTVAGRTFLNFNLESYFF